MVLSEGGGGPPVQLEGVADVALTELQIVGLYSGAVLAKYQVPLGFLRGGKSDVLPQLPLGVFAAQLVGRLAGLLKIVLTTVERGSAGAGPASDNSLGSRESSFEWKGCRARAAQSSQ